MSQNIVIREAEIADVAGAWKIYEYYRANTVSTLRHKDLPLEGMISNFRTITEQEHLPYLVATSGQAIRGYTYASGFKPHKLGYSPTVEISLFCHKDYWGQGIGARLLDGLFQKLETVETHSNESFHEDEIEIGQVSQAIAVMAVDEHGTGFGLRDWYINRGFVQVGHLKKVGFKHGRW